MLERRGRQPRVDPRAARCVTWRALTEGSADSPRSDGLGARRHTPRFREGAGGARGSGRAPRARRPAARRGAEDFRARRRPHPPLSGLAPGRAAESRDPPEEERPGADRAVRGADRRDGGPPGGSRVMSALPGSPERTTAAFTARIQAFRERIEGVLDRALELPDAGTSRLREAMRYSVLGAGKRLRPTLVYLTGESLGAPLTVLDVPAAAVELIHVYSLVHDDLPAMDDDDLQALGFAVLSSEPMEGTPASARLEMLRVLARAIGTRGMAGGQAVDLAAVGKRLSVSAVEDMHRRKTGALIECSVLLGALAAGVSGAAELGALRRFGAEIGLAFQIQDDILDVEGDPALLGKSIGTDAAHAKPTYPSTAGLAASRLRAARSEERRVAALAPFGERGAALAQLAGLMVSRVS